MKCFCKMVFGAFLGSMFALGVVFGIGHSQCPAMKCCHKVCKCENCKCVDCKCTNDKCECKTCK